jgi:[acyl-carrier-protein] S-malonyltransferase
MAGAANNLARALSLVRLSTPPSGGAAFFSTTEVRYPAPDELAEVMARQLVSPVKFTQSMEAVLHGPDAPDHAIEVGPGNVLSGLLKRIAKHVPAAPTADGHALEKVLAAVAAG